MRFHELRDRLARRGMNPHQVSLVHDDGRRPPPLVDETWTIVHSEDRYLLGSVDRGEFVPSRGEYATEEEACAALWKLLHHRPAQGSAQSEAEIRESRARMRERTRKSLGRLVQRDAAPDPNGSEP